MYPPDNACIDPRPGRARADTTEDTMQSNTTQTGRDGMVHETVQVIIKASGRHGLDGRLARLEIVRGSVATYAVLTPSHGRTANFRVRSIDRGRGALVLRSENTEWRFDEIDPVAPSRLGTPRGSNRHAWVGGEGDPTDDEVFWHDYEGHRAAVEAGVKVDCFCVEDAARPRKRDWREVYKDWQGCTGCYAEPCQCAAQGG